MKRLLLTIILSGTALLAGAQVFPYQDTRLSAEERAKNLLSLLTLEEKASLSINASAPIERLGIARYDWWNEALHGVARNGSATVFPQAIGMAASFDTELMLKVFTIASDEARVKHRLARESGEVGRYQGLTFWTPNINIFRDPRWGRGMETYGEDPYLTGQMGIMAVRGLQGDIDAPVLKTHACAKHFAVHSGLESNRHRFNADVSERDLRETYLPAFKDLVTKANVQEVMTAYNRFRGKPCAASDYLVNDILRGEWGYKGLVVSDCWAIDDFYVKGRHGFSDSGAMAAAAAVKTGVDVECGVSYVNIPEAVRSGLLDEAVLDRNLLRVLIQRFRLGEMDGWSPWDKLDASIVESDAHRSVSRQMARESIVLLQNRDDVLPLRSDKGGIALIGPNADDAEMQWGNYNGIPKTTVTLKTALKARVPNLVYFRACGIMGADYAPEDPALRQSFLPQLDIRSVLQQLDGIETVIFAGGISPRFEGEEMPVQVPGFSGGDRTEIDLPEVQRILLQALHEAGKKVILVNFSGSAMGLEPETKSCDAIIQAWYPGQEGGTAIADVIFGEISPSGKLPVTFYASVDDLPAVEDYNMEGHTYRYFRGKPVFAFGHGLSFVEFRYGKAKVRGNELVIPVKNTGRRPADEVVQLYVQKVDDDGGPNKTLRGFKRVSIPAGKTVDVRFTLSEEVFTWWNPETEVMEPLHGDYILHYGGSSDKVRTLRYTY